MTLAVLVCASISEWKTASGYPTKGFSSSMWVCSGGFMKKGGDSEAGGGGRAEQNKNSFRSDLAQGGQERGNNTLFLSCCSPSLSSPSSLICTWPGHLVCTHNVLIKAMGLPCMADSRRGHQGCRKIEGKGHLNHLQSQSHVSVHLASGLFVPLLRACALSWSKNGLCYQHSYLNFSKRKSRSLRSVRKGTFFRHQRGEMDMSQHVAFSSRGENRNFNDPTKTRPAGCHLTNAADVSKRQHGELKKGYLGSASKSGKGLLITT